jgi:hypothetical protein
MRHFDGEIENFIRSGVVDLETGLSYSSNVGNLRLELADFIENPKNAVAKSRDNRATEIEVEP